VVSLISSFGGYINGRNFANLGLLIDKTSSIYLYVKNIPVSPAYGVYISQLIRYARASSNYSDFLKRHLYLRNRLLDQGYKKIRLIRSLKKFIFRYQYLVEIFLRRQTSRSHYGSKVPAVTVSVFKYRNKIGKIVVKAVPYSAT
jgi:hypothetical protein